jgi:hypothetical protein
MKYKATFSLEVRITSNDCFAPLQIFLEGMFEAI